MINIFIFFTPFLLFMPLRIGTFYNFISKVPEFRTFTVRCHLWRIYWRVYIWFMMRMSFILMAAFQKKQPSIFHCFKFGRFVFHKYWKRLLSFLLCFCFLFVLEMWIKDSALATFHSWCHRDRLLLSFAELVVNLRVAVWPTSAGFR